MQGLGEWGREEKRLKKAWEVAMLGGEELPFTSIALANASFAALLARRHPASCIGVNTCVKTCLDHSDPSGSRIPLTA